MGPNYAWHCDGYDKLKPFGFPIHGCIDGWSRKVLWLYVTRSNNQPNNIAAYFLDAVDEPNGCPVDLVRDLGTENGIMAAAQAFFRNDENSQRYVASPRNKRIEYWWAQYSRSSAAWWINFFKDLVDKRQLDTTSGCKWNAYGFVSQKYCRRSWMKLRNIGILILFGNLVMTLLVEDQILCTTYHSCMVVAAT